MEPSIIWDHELKILSEYYQAVVSKDKKFEIRKNDRGFQVGDILKLNEISDNGKYYTGNSVSVVVTYLTSYEQKEDFVVMSIHVCE